LNRDLIFQHLPDSFPQKNNQAQRRPIIAIISPLSVLSVKLPAALQPRGRIFYMELYSRAGAHSCLHISLEIVARMAAKTVK